MSSTQTIGSRIAAIAPGIGSGSSPARLGSKDPRDFSFNRMTCSDCAAIAPGIGSRSSRDARLALTLLALTLPALHTTAAAGSGAAAAFLLLSALHTAAALGGSDIPESDAAATAASGAAAVGSAHSLFSRCSFSVSAAAFLLLLHYRKYSLLLLDTCL
ncbi:hypothetical protein M569_12588 [Genlisea aurea]|uniref:Uncharacterized protein n=1 Tax=Genlisea aurea TaxID=192259 RepID=S8DH92_9LAMI|nr:hypothetical protein M569_12588 [Genlisea aurea]